MQVTLIDFNASKKFDSGKNYDTCLMGTAEYAAPEQFGFSQSDARTDIYALGILLNILITGCFPKDVLCSGSAARVVTKCTQMDPARRYSSVLQLKSALRYISDTPVKHLYPFLPPGFRTMTWWKIIIALIMYPLLAILMSVTGFKRLQFSSAALYRKSAHRRMDDFYRCSLLQLS